MLCDGYGIVAKASIGVLSDIDWTEQKNEREHIYYLGSKESDRCAGDFRGKSHRDDYLEIQAV